MRILVVEDDRGVAEALGDAIGEAGWEADVCLRGDDGLHRIGTADLVVLDLGLPDMGGLEFLRTLRRVSAVPVLVLTARDSDGAVVLGLRAGADDYLVKPVGQAVLIARIHALARRSRIAGEDQAGAPTALAWGELSLDVAARTVRRGDAPVSLTATEFELLAALAARASSAVSREELQLQVWGTPDLGRSRSLDYFVAALRSKLGPDLPLQTVRGYGFRLG